MIYKLQLSNKEYINISEEELEKFKQNISANFIEFREGIINPSFVVCAVIDHEATRQKNSRLKNMQSLGLIESKTDDRGTESMKEALEKFKPEFLKK